ncbi:MAG: PH domain-containing protein [Aeromicrobium sp.]
MIFRPVGPRIVAYGSIAVLTVITIVIGVALPSAIKFTAAELVTLAVMVIVIFAGLHGIARSFVKVDDSGLTILNGYRRHHLDWTQVKGVAMNTGAPWPTVVTKDDERVIIFAIQGTDGPAAQEALKYIRNYIA